MKRKDFLAGLGIGLVTAPVLLKNKQVEAAVKDNIKASMLAAYPVGAIYISTVDKNPHDFLGGIWVAWGGVAYQLV